MKKNWIFDLSSSSKEDRVRVAKEIFARTRKFKEGKKLVDSIEKGNDYRKPVFITHLHYIPIGKNSPNSAKVLEFRSPLLAYNHKKLELVVAMAEKLPAPKSESIDKIPKEFEVKQSLSWLKAVSYMNSKEKQELLDRILVGFEAQRKYKKPDQKWLSDVIREGDPFEVLGFVANIPYYNINKKWGDDTVFWIHPWGTAQILLRHNELPIIMIAGPSIRLNKNIFGQSNMEGYTG